MASFFQTLFGLFTRRYASTREPVITRYAFDHASSFRNDMRHQFAFGTNLTSAMAELVDLRHVSDFTVDLAHASSFGSDMRHSLEIKKRD